MKKIVLIDGHSILNRAFYGVPDLTNSQGLHTNAVYGFLNIMLKVIDEEKPDFITVAFDVKHPTFRHEQYAEYKGTRKPMPPELHEQVGLLKEVLMAMNITIIERPGYEADDILGTIACNAELAGCKVTIISGDRDLLQLVTDKVTLRIPKTKGGKTIVEDYTPDMVKQVYQLEPKQIIDLKGLMGDASDNIPGLPGVGEKTATKLLLEYGTVENVLEHGEEITPNKAKNAVLEHSDLAILSKQLATIKTDCVLEYSIEEAGFDDMFNPESYEYIKRLEFKSLATRFEQDSTQNEDESVQAEIVTGVKDVKSRCDELTARFISKTNKNNSPDSAGVNSAVAVYLISDTKYKGRRFYNEQVMDDVINDEDLFGITGMVVVEGDGQPVVMMSASDMEYASEKNGSSVLSLDFEKIVRNFIWKLSEIHADVVMYDVKQYLDYLGLTEHTSIWDAGVGAYLLNPLNSTYSGDDIARDYLGRQIPSYKEQFGKLSVLDALGTRYEEFIGFAVKQCLVLRDAYSIIRDKLIKENMYKLYTDIEMPLIYTLHNMEVAGIHVNRDELKEYGERLEGRIVTLEQEIYKQAGEEFNINSPKQLGIILFEKLKLPYAKKTKTGYSTSADILDKLRIEDPIVPAVLEYRQLTKLKSTYADGLAVFIQDDGRIHGCFNQTITATGRISSTEPNLQNIPIRMELGREIRKVFVPNEGCVFLDADYSQIELRVLAHMSGDESLIQAYNEGQDIHSITASKVFHVPLEEMTSDLRRKAKAVNFGIVYGISSFGLGQDLNISKKEAEEYIKKYFETYPKVKTFLDNLVTDAKSNGCSYSEFGRKRPIPELSSSNFMQRSFGERVAMNAPIQGTAADIIKIAMINVEKRLKSEGLKSRLILQVHDELLLEVPSEEEAQASEILREEMVNAVSLKVAMIVDVKCGNNWYEAK